MENTKGINKPTVIDLFSGCGGISWGLSMAGFRVVAGIDIWEIALRTFKHNHKDSEVFCGDIKGLPAHLVMGRLQIKRGELDCLVGGPPCQGFSKNVPASYRFLDDPRNLLFRDFLDYVRAMYPKVVVMENVAEIYNAYDGEVRKEIEETLAGLGYQVVTKVLFAPDYGIPQQRRRCFFFASRTDTSPEFPNKMFAAQEEEDLFGKLPQFISAWQAISDLPVVQNGDCFETQEYPGCPQNDYQRLMRRNSDKVKDHITRELMEKQFLRVSSLKAGQAWKDLPKHLQPKSGYSGAYGRLDFEFPAPTITRWVFHPGSGRFCHPREDRLLTIREVARLQSFTDDFEFLGTYINKAHQLGNAVPPLFMYALSQKIMACLGQPESAVQSNPLPAFSSVAL